jgi:lipoprotein-anchoring transpeptidase ErfK/SrfK
LLAVAGAIIWIGSAAAAPLPVTATANSGALLAAVAIERPPVEAADVDQSEPALNFRRQLVDYSRNVAAGTVVIDTDQTYLYFVLGDGKAIRYGIGVGGEGNPLRARVDVGTKVVVLPNHNSAATIAASAVPAGIAAPRTYNTRLSNIY